ncbi:unnamed protein product [Polarella glacialis]|uniref:Uncharacterized protein n=1 Tax=Polarella glacialis TaxID=89957 RepID=A0A813E8U9_POLGL|nr:unnamed protein product [Polarella glacialis]
MFEKAVAHFRTFLPEEAGIGSPSAIEATAGQAKNDCASDAVANSPAGLPLLSHDQVREKLDKYEEMGLNGCSAQRIRGQMVRDGILVPGVSDSDPLTLPFLASFANGKSVTAVSISEGGTTLTWANGTVYARPSGEWTSDDLRGTWIDRGSQVEIHDAYIAGPNNGWFPAVILGRNAPLVALSASESEASPPSAGA